MTREELAKSMYEGNKERERQLRALMLVLPYHTDNLSSENLEEIYTKSPITKLVNELSKKPVQSHVIKVPESFELTKSKVTTFRPLPNTSPAFKFDRNVNPSTYHPKKLSETSGKSNVNDNVQDVLASLGLFPDSGIVNQFNQVTNMGKRFTTQEIRTSTEAIKTTTNPPETTTPDLEPELQKLLQTYGLLNENGDAIELTPLPLDIDSEPLVSSLLKNHNLDGESNGRGFSSVKNLEAFSLKLEKPLPISTTTTEPPQRVSLGKLLKPEDYAGFRPLTVIEEGMDKEMEDFLRQFGIIDNAASRGQKSMKDKKATIIPTTTESSEMKLDPGFFSDDQMSILDQIGFTMKDSKKSRKINSKAATNIFKPNQLNKSKTDREDFKKLEQLLDTIKELDRLNANLTDEELDKFDLKRFNLSDALLSQIPHPLELDGHAYALPLKNDIKYKRQNSDLADNNSTSSTDLEIISTTNSESKSSNIIQALKLVETTEESVLPSSTTVSAEEEKKNVLEDEIDPLTGEEEPLPPPRRNGFYFLADWNSFLEVGEDPDKIVVRFDPKVGDPSRFIEVKIP